MSNLSSAFAVGFSFSSSKFVFTNMVTSETSQVL